MQITITATLTPEQVAIVSSQKGYSETTTELQDGVLVQVANPVTREEFIKEVYYNSIVNDVDKIFIDQLNKSREAERLAEEQAIRDMVRASITSSIE